MILLSEKLMPCCHQMMIGNMRGLILLIACSLYVTSYSQEKIYGDFYLFQPKKEVKKTFKKNKDKYQNINFGGQEFWMINKLLISSFIYQSDKLTTVRLFSKTIGTSHDLQTQNIKDLDAYFLENGFEELYRQTHWDTPVFFDNAQFGVAYKNPNGNTVINLSMRSEAQLNGTVTLGSTGEFKNNHTYIDIIPYSLYEREMNKRKQNKQIDNSDF